MLRKICCSVWRAGSGVSGPEQIPRRVVAALLPRPVHGRARRADAVISAGVKLPAEWKDAACQVDVPVGRLTVSDSLRARTGKGSVQSV